MTVQMKYADFLNEPTWPHMVCVVHAGTLKIIRFNIKNHK